MKRKKRLSYLATNLYSLPRKFFLFRKPFYIRELYRRIFCPSTFISIKAEDLDRLVESGEFSFIGVDQWENVIYVEAYQRFLFSGRITGKQILPF